MSECRVKGIRQAHLEREIAIRKDLVNQAQVEMAELHQQLLELTRPVKDLPDRAAGEVPERNQGE